MKSKIKIGEDGKATVIIGDANLTRINQAINDLKVQEREVNPDLSRSIMTIIRALQSGNYEAAGNQLDRLEGIAHEPREIARIARLVRAAAAETKESGDAGRNFKNEEPDEPLSAEHMVPGGSKSNYPSARKFKEEERGGMDPEEEEEDACGSKEEKEKDADKPWDDFAMGTHEERKEKMRKDIEGYKKKNQRVSEGADTISVNLGKDGKPVVSVGGDASYQEIVAGIKSALNKYDAVLNRSSDNPETMAQKRKEMTKIADDIAKLAGGLRKG